MNQMGKRTVSTMTPVPGKAASMRPDMTLSTPEMRESMGPKPVYRSTWMNRMRSATPMTTAATP